MSKNTFALLTGTVFLIVAVAHALRLVFKWELIVAGWQVPMWVSAVAIIAAGYLQLSPFVLQGETGHPIRYFL